METHAALQAKATAARRETTSAHPRSVPDHGDDPGTAVRAGQEDPSFVSSASVGALAAQLQSLWRREKAEKSRRDGRESTGPHADDEVALPSLRASLEKIGPREKDELLLHLLGQQEALRTQRSEVAALGEKIAAQLLSQQHELQQKYLQQTNELEAQLHDATHFHPQVAVLQTKVDELEESNREHEQKLRFAVRTSESSGVFKAEYG
ncbi:hypothetical protein BBJ28_00014496 [Nothophytophthora sp. Chile5]|nr:hypothetical protein BBJ28_00014496 [Nothophytophthora sp. Chile5]